MFVYTVDVHGKQDISYKTRCTKLDVLPYVHMFVYIDQHISICLSIQTNICLSILRMYMKNQISITKLDAKTRCTKLDVLYYVHMFVCIDLHISICLSIQTNICLSILWMYMKNQMYICVLKTRCIQTNILYTRCIYKTRCTDVY